MPGKWWSDVYMALPLTFSGPSTRGCALPMTDSAACWVAGMMNSPDVAYADWVACARACRPSPGLRAAPPHPPPGARDLAIGSGDHHRGRGEREFVRCPVAQLQ